MAITHATIKAALQKLFAVADWNANHTGTLDHGADLTNVTSDQHHAKQHAINSAADHTGFGDIVTRNSSEFAAATILQNAFPIGSIYLTGTNINPGTFLGFGTWVTMGAGRVLVGLDAGDPDFDTPLETGGSKTTSVAHTHAGPSHTHTGPNHTHTTGSHALTVAQMPSHSHKVYSQAGAGFIGANQIASATASIQSQAVGGGDSHNHGDTGFAGTGIVSYGGTGATGAMSANSTPSIVQPYLVVYIWIRNA